MLVVLGAGVGYHRGWGWELPHTRGRRGLGSGGGVGVMGGGGGDTIGGGGGGVVAPDPRAYMQTSMLHVLSLLYDLYRISPKSQVESHVSWSGRTRLGQPQLEERLGDDSPWGLV